MPKEPPKKVKCPHPECAGREFAPKALTGHIAFKHNGKIPNGDKIEAPKAQPSAAGGAADAGGPSAERDDGGIFGGW